MSVLESINNILPPRINIKLYTEPDCYGATSLIAAQLRLPFRLRSFTNWQHGWIYGELRYLEQYGIISDYKYLVATIDQERFISERGKQAKAIGAPYIYATHYDTVNVTRNENSLLVMPPHGLDYTNEKWNEGRYVAQIYELKSQFEHIVVCIHPSSAIKGHWRDAFAKIGVDCVYGADMHDRSGLVRMHRLFKSFGYMTTNTIGSHIVYAAHSGCKVSLYGDYEEYSSEMLKADVLFQTYPFMLDYWLHLQSYAYIKKKYPFLFLQPEKASILKDWADNELGCSERRSPYEVARELGWMPQAQIHFWSSKVFNKIKREATKIMTRSDL